MHLFYCLCFATIPKICLFLESQRLDVPQDEGPISAGRQHPLSIELNNLAPDNRSLSLSGHQHCPILRHIDGLLQRFLR